MSQAFQIQQCRAPLLVSIPHAGTQLGTSLAQRLTGAASALPDTDWFVDRLYDWVPEIGAGLIVAQHSRYLVDLNRPADDCPLYTTPTPGLVPFKTFDGKRIYRRDAPGEFEIRRRIEAYWQPYHDALCAELLRVRRHFGYVILFDAHSIRSRVPNLFEGRLPDLNLGTFDGHSASPGLVEAAASVLSAQQQYSHVVDGRFKGGYITRHYGRPEESIHALQLEMSQSIYMQESSPRFEPDKAESVKELLRRLLNRLLEWGDDHG